MKSPTLLSAIKHIYQLENSNTETLSTLESVTKYLSDKKELGLPDFIHLLNDFTYQTGIYILAYNYEPDEFREMLRTNKFNVVVPDKYFENLFVIKPNSGKPSTITKFHQIFIDQVEDIPNNEVITEEGTITAYVLSKTKGLFDVDGQFQTTEKSSDPKEKKNYLNLLFRLLKPDKTEIIFLYIYAIFTGLLSLSLPLGIQSIVGLVMGAQYSSSLFLMIFLVLLGVLVTGLMQIMQLWLVESIQQKIFVRSAFEFAFKAAKIKLEALEDKYAPELMNRFFDTVNIQKSLPKILIDFTQANIQILFGLILLSFYHPLFLVFGAALLGVFYLIFRITGPPGMKSSVKESKYKYAVAFWLEEVARTMRIFKVAGNTNLPLEKTDKIVSNYVDSRKSHFRILATQFSYMVLFKILVTGTLLIMGSVLIMKQQINIGQFVASEIIIILILNSIEKVILSLENIYDLLTSVDKLASVTELPLDRNDGVPYHYIDNGKGMAIDLKIQSYKALKTNFNILHNIDLQIKSGEKVCITGPNGSGRSSLLSLLTGLYSNYSGQILFNNVPINNINLRSFHDFVAQNFAREAVFRGTLFENITLGRKDISMQDVLWAIDLTGLNTLVAKLPKGLESELAPEDKSIPNSEIIKIILARCLAERPRLMLLEEFLETFDYKHRKTLIDYVTGLGDTTTLLTISNDPEIASKCDRVIVMDKGTIIFDGKFEDIRKEEYLRTMFYSML